MTEDEVTSPEQKKGLDIVRLCSLFEEPAGADNRDVIVSWC